MRRRLFAAGSAISLLLWLATAGLWGLSYSANPIERSYIGADLSSETTARYWHKHVGLHDGGFYCMSADAMITPSDRSRWATVGKREWHHGERLFGAVDYIDGAERFGLLSPTQQGDPLAPDWYGRAFQFSVFRDKGHVLVIPDWLLLILSAVLPVLWVWGRIRQRRYRPASPAASSPALAENAPRLT
jgi:hypothetical protein